MNSIVMADGTKANRLHQHMGQMVSLETSMEKMLEQLQGAVSGHRDVSVFVKNCLEVARTQCKAIKSRLHEVADDMVLPGTEISAHKTGVGLPLSSAIQQIHVALDSVIIGYSVLQLLALRYCDNYLAGDGNTADLAVQHYQRYVIELEKIKAMLHDVVVWDLDEEDVACQCTCPCCDLGVCLCAPSSRSDLNDARANAGADINQTGVYVYPPKPGSAAIKAGLQLGDVIEAVDGEELKSLWMLHEVVESHQTDEAMNFRVRRPSGEIKFVSIVRARA